MKTKFLSNILLMFVWVALTGSLTFLNFLFGFWLSFLTLWIVNRSGEQKKYFRILPKIIGLFFFFLYELVAANIQVAYYVVFGKEKMKPGIVKVPLEAETDMEITLLANLISLTPGSLTLDVSNDRKVIYIHAMHISDKESYVRGIKNGFERRLLEILR